MAKWGECDYSELEAFREKLEKLADETDEFCVSCAKELAARLLALVIPATPVYKEKQKDKVYKRGDKKGQVMKTKSGKVRTEDDLSVNFTTSDGKEVSFVRKHKRLGGTLRRGWTSQTHEEAVGGSGKSSVAEGKAFGENLKVTRKGDIYEIEVINPVEYSPYVEFGHRTPGGKGWVAGRFFLTASELKLEAAAPRILEKKLEKKLREVFGDG